jgi:phosphoribosylformylglycinamidine synthase
LSAADADTLAAEAAEAGVALRRLGTVGGERLDIHSRLSVPVMDLTIAHESWFPAYMSGAPDIAVAAE